MTLLKTPYFFAVGILAFLVILGWFYWFQWKPSQIRRNCTFEASIAAKELLKTLIDKPGEYERGISQKELEETYNAGLFSPSDYDRYYHKCLNRNGFK